MAYDDTIEEVPALRNGEWGTFSLEWPDGQQCPTGYEIAEKPFHERYNTGTLVTYRRRDHRDPSRPRYLVGVWFRGDTADLMAAWTIVDLGAIYATWTPIARDNYLLDTLDELVNANLSTDSAGVMVAAALAYGVQNVPTIEREQLERRRAARPEAAAKKAASVP